MKTLWNSICREAPDAAGGAPAPVDPPAGGNEAPAAAVAPENNALGEQSPQPDPASPAPAPAKRAAPDWAFKRISEESAKAQEALQRAQEAERRAAAAEALAARLQSGQNAPQTQQQPATQNQIDPALVRAEAERIRFNEDVTDIRSRGFADFGTSFNDTIAALGALNAATPDFISDVLAVDKANAHKILREIAEDGERAVALANMTPRQRIAELTRMTIKAPEPASKAQEPARQVSKAPAPPPPVTPSSTQSLPVYSDKLSDAEFTAQFNERMKARTARR